MSTASSTPRLRGAPQRDPWSVPSVYAPPSDLHQLIVHCKDELHIYLRSQLEVQESMLRTIQMKLDERCRGNTTLTSSNYPTGSAMDTDRQITPPSPSLLREVEFCDRQITPVSVMSTYTKAMEQLSPEKFCSADVHRIVHGAEEALSALNTSPAHRQQTPSNEKPEEDSAAMSETLSSMKSAWRKRAKLRNRHSAGESSTNLAVNDGGRWRQRWTAIMSITRKFNMLAILQCLSIIVVLVDAVVIAVETDMMAQHGEDTTYKQTVITIDYVIVSWYMLELAIRVLSEKRMINFFIGSDWRWNLFDLSLTLMSVSDLLLSNSTIRLRPVAILRLLRVMRILRLIRMLRIFRLMAFLREFHKLVLCLASSVQTLFPAMILMCFLIFCMSILFTQSVVKYLQDNEHADLSMRLELKDSFGSVSDSMVSLYMAITSGKNWGEQYELLQHVSPSLSFLFFVFLMISIFGLTNVVTAVFVESAMQATQNYRELLVQEMLLKERSNVKHMVQIFQSIDLDGSGRITEEEMAEIMRDESKQLQEYFEALGLSASDTSTLFNLLDSDGSGEIDIEEFCEGCMRLGGAAKSFDMNCMWHEQRRTNREILKFIQHACVGLHSLARSQQAEAKDFAQVAGQVQWMLEKKHARYGHRSNKRGSESVSTTAGGAVAASPEAVKPEPPLEKEKEEHIVSELRQFLSSSMELTVTETRDTLASTNDDEPERPCVRPSSTVAFTGSHSL